MSREQITVNASAAPGSGDIVRRLMDDALVKQDPEAVDAYFAREVTFIAIVPDSPELTAIVPWYGTRHSPAEVKEVYALLLADLELPAFEPKVAFGSCENAAMFGRFRFRSKITGKVVDSEWAIRATVHDGPMTYFQFCGDDCTIAATFRRGGRWDVASHPGPRPVR